MQKVLRCVVIDGFHGFARSPDKKGTDRSRANSTRFKWPKTIRRRGARGVIRAGFLFAVAERRRPIPVDPGRILWAHGCRVLGRHGGDWNRDVDL